MLMPVQGQHGNLATSLSQPSLTISIAELYTTDALACSDNAPPE